MDKRVYLLTIVAFIVGMVELIIGGILDLVAHDLGISIGQAGLLITYFSLVFAVAAPILLLLTARVERTRLTIVTLGVFFISNLIAILGQSYAALILARIVSAASSSLLVVLCITLASNIVDEEYRGRAIGLVIMGISGSIVLGVPFGVLLGHNFGWRAPFVFIALLTVVLAVVVFLFMGQVAPKPVVPLREQLATLKNRKILFAQLTTFFFLAGHFTLYGYLTPFAIATMDLDGIWLSIVYFLFGLAAVSGGGIAGFSADRFGIRRTLLSITILFSICLFLMPYVTLSLPLFLGVVMVWGVLSWGITPPVQSYLIQVSPETSDIQQSLNNSALHFGIAFGTFVGSFVVEQASVQHNATVGGLFIILSILTATLALRSGKERKAFSPAGRMRSPKPRQ